MTMTESKNITYVPGVCNIGPEEISRRRLIGWVGLLITAVLFAALFVTHVDPLWRLFAFLPATMSAAGFLQAATHFCSGFAQKGLYNLGPIGKTETVPDKASAQKDKQKGGMLTIYSVLIGIIVTIILVTV